MTFRVDPFQVREYARKLGDVERVAEEAGRYVSAHGSFTILDQGLMGFVAPGHRQLMGQLHDLFARLGDLGAGSRTALRAAADTYVYTDERSASALDASYPPVHRNALFRG
ncbi:hypothetical protein Ait01nite_065600 [Actinoplanes italicus]|uniref:Excreted virulence factor EspC (Type VII ESX diderm) n=1 Tax=Actinoplanes italicus TaxID=113567 RepID=A0A2T0KQA5_9ACTN|nr:hypothetical protein [Actinoplanes italicus]PRX25931.1 hypothetical protein CLV67_101657 [Actinoplanes italicus]GIE33515.1 hypothetical protein Ait01nite_065600 [Actinoplanes italicus]